MMHVLEHFFNANITIGDVVIWYVGWHALDWIKAWAMSYALADQRMRDAYYRNKFQ